MYYGLCSILLKSKLSGIKTRSDCVDDQSEDDTYDLLESISDPRFVRMRLGVYIKGLL